PRSFWLCQYFSRGAYSRMMSTLPSADPPSMTTTSSRGYSWRKMLSNVSRRKPAWLYDGTTTLISGRVFGSGMDSGPQALADGPDELERDGRLRLDQR